MALPSVWSPSQVSQRSRHMGLWLQSLHATRSARFFIADDWRGEGKRFTDVHGSRRNRRRESKYWALLYEGESGHWVRDFIITLSDLNCIMRFVTTKSSCTTIFATRSCIKSSSQFLWKCLMRRAKWKDASSIQTCANSQRNFSSVLKKVSEKLFK